MRLKYLLSLNIISTELMHIGKQHLSAMGAQNILLAGTKQVP